MSKTVEPPKTAAELGLMQGSPVPTDKLVNLTNWQEPPCNRWSFQHVQDLIPTARVTRGDGSASQLDYALEDFDELAFTNHDDVNMSIAEMLILTYTDAFLVMHQGKVITEEYFNDMYPGSLHLIMSCTKSYTGTLAGIFVDNGDLDIAASVEKYLPELKGTGFAGATVQQILNMSAGVKFSEEYTNPESEIRQSEIAYGWRPRPQDYAGPGTQLDYIMSLKDMEFEHGEKFEYRSVITNVLAWLIERVAGERLQDLFGEIFWQALACEWDAAITVDSAYTATAEGGFNVALRDFARFGQMILQNGYYNGIQIIPESWINDCRFGNEISHQAFQRSKYIELFPQGNYHNQWWCFNHKEGIIAALGIHGQTLYINPDKDLVIAKFSTQPEAEDHPMFLTQFAGMETIANALS